MQVETTENNTNVLTQNDNTTIDYVLRYELYRHRDLSERLAIALNADQGPEPFNRSTWDILFFLVQSYLEGTTPSVTDIYLAASISKGTAISGLTVLESKNAIRKVSDPSDRRRRLITITDNVAEIVNAFIDECQERLGQTGTGDDNSRHESGEPLINLLYEMSHEIRTPLTAIIGFSDMIADESLGPVQPVGYAEYARDIGKAAAHLLNSLNERVDTALAEHGASISLGARARYEVDEIVDSACRLATPVAERRGVALQRRWGAKSGYVSADKERLIQAIKKLVEGLVSISPRGVNIDVETLPFNKDSVPFLCVRVLTPKLITARETSPLSDSSHASPDNVFARSLKLVDAIAAAHGGFVTKEQSGDNSLHYSICLPRAI